MAKAQRKAEKSVEAPVARHGNKADRRTGARRQDAAPHQGAGARGLRDDAPHPPLRGARRPDVRHGPDRRILPPLYRPGSRRRRHADGDRGGRPGHHRLSRSRPHARLRHGPEGRDGRAHRPPHRLFPRQGRLDAHVLAGEELLRRPRHRRARRCRSAPASPSPTATARTAASASPISATAPPTRARSTRASTWRSSGSCPSSTSSRTTATPWAPRSTAPRRRPIFPGAALSFNIPGEQVDGMDIRAVKAAGDKARRVVPRRARVRTSSKC